MSGVCIVWFKTRTMFYSYERNYHCDLFLSSLILMESRFLLLVSKLNSQYNKNALYTVL